MPTNSQIENILKCLKTPSSKSGWWGVLDTPDRILLIGAGVSLISGIVIAWSSRFATEHHPPTVIASYGFLLLGQIGYILFALKQAYAPVKNLFRPTDGLLDARSPSICRDAQVLLEIREFDPTDLKYAGIRLKLEAEQARKRIALFSPGIEKLGILPAVIGGILAIFNFTDTFNRNTGMRLPEHVVLYICVALGLVNITSIPVLIASYRFDQLAQLLTFAASKKRGETDCVACDDDEKSPNSGKNGREDGIRVDIRRQHI